MWRNASEEEKDMYKKQHDVLAEEHHRRILEWKGHDANQHKRKGGAMAGGAPKRHMTTAHVPGSVGGLLGVPSMSLPPEIPQP